MVKGVKPFKKPIYVTRPFLPDYEEFGKKIEEIFDSGQLTNRGPQLMAFKDRLGEFLKTPNVSLFCNGTQALELGLKALNLSGEVITTPFTFVATTHAIVRNGLTPVFCDIEGKTFNIDPDKIETLITEKTSAILAVHVYGNPCDFKRIQAIADKYRLKVIYDAAHAFGVKMKGISISAFGDMTMFSFHATKTFNTFEGGALIFRDDRLGRRLDLLKNFGIESEERITMVGTNAKMNEIQAAMGLVLLDKFYDEVEKRKKLTKVYRRYLKDIPGIKFMEDMRSVAHTYQYFPIIIEEDGFGLSRDEIHRKLRKYNVFARKYFYPLCSQIDSYRALPSADPASLPVAHEVACRVLCLPLYGGLHPKDIARIVAILKD
jgi:dTDP-4-amino-4,6-dideoxygalactose transaminase